MGTQLVVEWRAFSLPKRGNSAKEYEDAYAADPKVGRFAVADGASESSFANVWAQLLVEGFIHPPNGSHGENDWLAALRQRWSVAVGGMALSWYGEEKRDQGAYATFLGLSLRPLEGSAGGRWKALAIGDSCLFQVRQNALISAFPMSRSKDFGNQPPLLGSRPSGGAPLVQQQRLERGRWQPGDHFLLMTDALAQWFLQRIEAKLKPWQSLHKRLAEPQAESMLTAYIEKLRTRDELRNDDITLVSITLLKQE